MRTPPRHHILRMLVLATLGLAVLAVGVGLLSGPGQGAPSERTDSSAQLDDARGDGLDWNTADLTSEASDSEPVSGRGLRLSEAADRVLDAITHSSDREILSTIVIDSVGEAVIAHFIGEPAAETRRDAKVAAGSTRVEFATDALVTSEQFVDMVEAMYRRIDPERKMIGLISPNASNTAVTLSVREHEGREQTVRAIRQALSPLTVTVDAMPEPEGPVDYAG